MSTNFDVNRIREDFPIFKNHPDLIYLDNSATSQKPFQVIRAVTEFYEKSNANPLRGLYSSPPSTRISCCSKLSPQPSDAWPER